MFPPVPSPVSHAESNAQRWGVYRVNKESLKVLGLRTQLQGPGDLPLEDLVDGVYVVQVRPLGEQQLSPPCKQTLRNNRHTSVQSRHQLTPEGALLLNIRRIQVELNINQQVFTTDNRDLLHLDISEIYYTYYK